MTTTTIPSPVKRPVLLMAWAMIAWPLAGAAVWVAAMFLEGDRWWSFAAIVIAALALPPYFLARRYRRGAVISEFGVAGTGRVVEITRAFPKLSVDDDYVYDVEIEGEVSGVGPVKGYALRLMSGSARFSLEGREVDFLWTPEFPEELVLVTR